MDNKTKQELRKFREQKHQEWLSTYHEFGCAECADDEVRISNDPLPSNEEEWENFYREMQDLGWKDPKKAYSVQTGW